MGVLSRCLIVAASLAVIVPRVGIAADISIVHGINGKDIGASQALPVDISINGACVLKRVSFRQSAGVEVGAGAYTVKVFGSSSAGCAGAALIEKTVNIPTDTNFLSFSLVANLSATGTPQLSLFSNTGYLTGTGSGVTVRHVAKTEILDARVEIYPRQRTEATKVVTLGKLRNGEEAGYSAARGDAKGSEVGSRYRVFIRSQVDGTAAGKNLAVVVGGAFTASRRVIYVVGSKDTGLAVIGQVAKGQQQPTPVASPTPQDVFPYCAKLGEGRKENGDALPGYRCVGKDPCASCQIICGHPSSVVNASATGATWNEQYNAARTRFPGKMPTWPGGGTNYKPGDATLDKACNLAGFREHVSSSTNTWSSPGDNFLISWDSAQKRFVKLNGATQGGRWAGSIRCKGLLHPSCREPSNLGWIFE